MTLSERNLYIKCALVFEILLFICMAIIATLLLLKKQDILSLYAELARPLQPDFLNQFAVCRENTTALILQQVLFPLYSSLLLFTVYFLFEKTYVTDISFFIFFALFIGLESIKLLIPLFNLWTFFPDSVRFISRLLHFFRMLGIFVLVVGTIFIDTPFSRRVTPILFSLSFLSFAMTAITPFNTSFFRFNFLTSDGLNSITTNIFIFFTFIIFITYFIAGKTKGAKAYITASWSITLLLIGYFLTLYTANTIFFLISNSFFILGSYFYLRSIHSYNLWL